MKAAVLEQNQTIEVKDVSEPAPSAEEVLIKVSLAGICGSDHSLYHGRFGVSLPVIPGHEAIGTIVETGSSVHKLKVGQRVTIQPNFSCGACALCASGAGNLCPAKIRLGVDIDGVFADMAKVPARYVWPVPEEMDDNIAVYTEPLAVAVHAMKVAAPSESDNVLIFGAGVIGLLALQLAALKGARVSATDLSESRLELARRLGAAKSIGADTPIESHYNTFNLIYETSGAPVALNLAMRLAAPRAKIVVLGLPGKEHPISADLIVRKELKILGSMIYTDEFPESLEILKSGHVQTDALTTGIISLGELDSALKEFSSPARVKTLVRL